MTSKNREALSYTDFPRRWTVQALADMFSASRKWIRTKLVPLLVKRGALVKIGKAWIGRVSAIEAAVLGQEVR